MRDRHREKSTSNFTFDVKLAYFYKSYIIVLLFLYRIITFSSGSSEYIVYSDDLIHPILLSFGSFFIYTFQKIAERIRLRKGLSFIEIFTKGYRLDEMCHPFLTNIHIGKFEVHSSLLHKIQPNKVKFLLPLGNRIDRNVIRLFLITYCCCRFLIR